MYYFNNYPLTRFNNKSLLDIRKRINFKTLEWAKSPALYYDYKIQDSDTPDIIADKYYEDASLFWIILITNGIINPQFELPLNSLSFRQYVDDKYSEQASEFGISGLTYAMNTPDPLFGYQKLVTVRSLIKGIITQDYYAMDVDSYNNIEPLVYYFNDENNETFEYSVKKNNIVTIYDAENNANENKRWIKILKKEYKYTFINQVKSIITG